MLQSSLIKEELMRLSLPIGIIIVSSYPEYNIIYANKKLSEMLGYKDENESISGIYKSAWDFIYHEDIKRLKGEADVHNGSLEAYEVTFRIVRKDGSLIWVNQCSQHQRGEDGQEVVYAYYTDMTKQKRVEQALRESESRYAAAIHSADINIWEYNYALDEMIIYSKSPKVNPKNYVVANYSKEAVNGGHIREDSAILLFDMIDRLKRGEKEVTADLWIRNSWKDDYWCERVIYTNAFDDEGKPVRAYCVGRDITTEKEAEKRYHDELAYREAMQKATMVSINVNLTKNIILDYKSIFTEVSDNMKNAVNVQAYFDNLYSELATKEMQQQCKAMFNIESLLKQFATGKTTISLELIRKINGRRYWTMLTAHMMKKENGEIIAFLYSTDITNERTMQHIMNAVVKTDYDFLVVIDATRNSAVRYSEKNLQNDYAYQSEAFEPETLKYVEQYIIKSDIKRVEKELTIRNIIKQLENQTTFSIFYGMPNEDGGVYKKELRFSYINRELLSILMTRIDISEAVEEQEKRNKELVEAVTMAQHANEAKSEFLSRISHELRTPMNAIMGMDQLAMQHLLEPDFLADCIEKSQYASRYLLQLLNDILDMSKIETGKVTLKNEPFVCATFLDSINIIIEEQASNKGVRYIVSKFEGLPYRYIGDSVRLQQILINILTNAVKFTAKRGVVHLDIAQLSVDGKIANICFTISDTGIGISEAFLSELFNPFAQEHNGLQSSYGGSGLGLAISKNLAELMGGNILVESTHSKGTTFKVQIPLEILIDDRKIEEDKHSLHKDQDYDFSDKRILLVEDQPINVMVAKKLLEYKNAIVDVAENGKIACAMFENSKELMYDAVLMDIRMPIMDGYEATKVIRSSKHTQAKRIPIIAMTANAFDEDVNKSKVAGMNAHLPKPIDASLLYETLYEAIAKSKQE